MVEVIKPGLNTTVQDLGRFQGLGNGIPCSGAMDKQSLRFGQSLLNNPHTEAALEFCMIGPVLKFHNDCNISITGVDLKPVINGEPVPVNKTLSVKSGAVLRFLGSNTPGVYGYICFKGKLDVPLVLGSKSTYCYASIGGFKGRSLRAGDLLNIGESIEFKSKEKPSLIKNQPEIRILAGPEFDDFPKKDLEQFVNSVLTISKESNRMGAKIDNVKLSGTDSGNIISSGTIPGTIQVPASGVPIVLLADSPCTGGYPRIGVVHSDDLDQFCQIKPGSTFTFTWTK